MSIKNSVTRAVGLARSCETTFFLQTYLSTVLGRLLAQVLSADPPPATWVLVWGIRPINFCVVLVLAFWEIMTALTPSYISAEVNIISSTVTRMCIEFS
jgi:hypothetical protein